MLGNRNRAADVRDGRSPAPLADPYLEWASAASFDVMSIEGDWVPLLVELNDRIRLAEFAARPWLTRRDLRSSVRVPVLYRTAPQGLAAATVCTVLVRTRAFREVIADPGWNRNIRHFGFGLPLSNVPAVRPSPAGRARGVRVPPQPQPVVIGLIDDGLAFAHERFCEPGQRTRIQYLWNQEAMAAPPVGAVPYGRELTAADIDRALSASLAGGQIDDSDVYYQLRHEDYRNSIHKAVGRRIAHGTHVMDLAATVAAPPAAAARPIIAVQVSSKVTGDTSGAHLTAAVLDGIWYILNRADRLAPRGSLADVVINTSYGMLAGPHDGSHALEMAIDQIVRGRQERGAKLAVVLPVGNDRLSRCH